MDSRTAADTRIWRLAFMLSGGDHRAAMRIVQHVELVDTDRSLLDRAHLDRLIVLRTRQLLGGWRPAGKPARTSTAPSPGAASIHAGTPAPAPNPAQGSARATLSAAEFALLDRAWAMIRALSPQPREAWILARVDGLDEKEMARSMDCSRTAAGRFLEIADAQAATDLGPDRGAALDALRRHLESLDPLPILRAWHDSRRQRRRVAIAITILGIIVVVGAAWLALERWVL